MRGHSEIGTCGALVTFGSNDKWPIVVNLTFNRHFQISTEGKRTADL